MASTTRCFDHPGHEFGPENQLTVPGCGVNSFGVAADTVTERSTQTEGVERFGWRDGGLVVLLEGDTLRHSEHKLVVDEASWVTPVRDREPVRVGPKPTVGDESALRGANIERPEEVVVDLGRDRPPGGCLTATDEVRLIFLRDSRWDGDQHQGDGRSQGERTNHEQGYSKSSSPFLGNYVGTRTAVESRDGTDAP